ncbi:MAG: ATP-binding protein [Candidatus Omnitrophota bacterium]|nr:ATP-binding protein [Candidatus Omnitrophota bacterium]
MIRRDQSAFSKSLSMETKKTVIIVPSETKSIRMVSFKLLEAIKPYGVSEDTLYDIRLCTEEAVRNAIVHGNLSDVHLLTTVSYWIEEDKIFIEVEDEGVGFDRGNLPDPTTDDNILKSFGRGVYLIEKLMDSARFNQSGNKITMTKKIK